jgi:hypothetical protein
MTILNRTPSNPNFLLPNRFQLGFARSPNVQYFCQSLSIPGISLSEVVNVNPFVDVYVPGEKAIYDTLSITFTLDEELSSWMEIHDWIRGMTFPENFEEYQNLSRLSRNIPNPNRPQYSDATITLLSSSYAPTWRFNLKDVFPTSLSAFVMSASDGPENTLTADATFRFAYYNVEKLF